MDLRKEYTARFLCSIQGPRKWIKELKEKEKKDSDLHHEETVNHQLHPRLVFTSKSIAGDGGPSMWPGLRCRSAVFSRRWCMLPVVAWRRLRKVRCCSRSDLAPNLALDDHASNLPAAAPLLSAAPRPDSRLRLIAHLTTQLADLPV